MRAGLSIGDFSRITHLSVKTLRHYHATGLLEPAEIDDRAGYRYYLTDQVSTAQIIHQFRELGMPLAQISLLLAAPDKLTRHEVISEYLHELESQLHRTRTAFLTLRRLVAPVPIQVERRSDPATRVAAISATVEHSAVLDWYSASMDELDTWVRTSGHRPSGPAGGLYENDLFVMGRGEATVYLPVAHPVLAGRVRSTLIPAAELAVAVHHGAHHDIDVTYGELGSWVVERGLLTTGPVRERYLVGPRDNPEPASWRTELGWPLASQSNGPDRTDT